MAKRKLDKRDYKKYDINFSVIIVLTFIIIVLAILIRFNDPVIYNYVP